MNELEQLIAIEAIKQLKARYFRCMDTKNWEGLREVFTENATFDARGAIDPPDPNRVLEGGPERGIDAIIAYIKTGLEPLVSVHHGHMPEIAILSPLTARGIWPMTDYLSGGPPGSRLVNFTGFGHYHETYEKVMGQWRIATLKLTRLKVQWD